MAKLSNINGRFAVEDDGAIQFNGSAGVNGYVLESRGDSSPPVWTDRDTGNVIGTGTENKVVRWNAAPATGDSQTIGDGPITFSGSAATANSTFGGNVIQSGTSPQYQFVTPSNFNFQIAVQENVSNALEITPSTAAGGTTFSTPAVLINSSGNVGIGTNSPSAKLEINGALFVGNHTGTVTPTSGIFIEEAAGVDTQIQMYTFGGSVFRIKGSEIKADIGWGSSQNRSVNFNNTGTGSISVGIGTTTPGRELDVIGVIKAQGTFHSIVSSTSTNYATASGGSLNLYNSSSTDGNFSNIGGYNSNSLVTSQINFINESHTSRTGAITFNTHNGGSMPERMRITSGGDILMGNTVVNPASGFATQKGFGYDAGTGQTQIATTDNASTLVLGRNNATDGSIIDLRKESVIIGTFGSNTTGGQTLLDISANATNGNMRFLTANAERMRINSSGNVGIGTASPDIGSVAGTRVLTIASPTAERWGILELAGNRTWGGNQVGEIKFISTDATNNGVLVSLTTINDPSATGTGGSLKFSTRVNGGSITEKMRIKSDANVTFAKGPDTTRDANSIKHASNDFLYIRGGAAGIVIADDGEDTRMIMSNNGNIRFDAGTKDNAMIIEGSTGNVGIGTTSPDFALDIEVIDGGVQLQMGRTNTNVGSTWMGSDSNGFHLGVGAYGAGNSATDPNGFTVLTSGNVGIGTASPNAKLDVKNDDGVASGLHIIADFNRAAGADAQMLLGYFANGSTVDGPCVYAANGMPLILAPGTEKLRIQNSAQSLRVKGGAVTGSNYMQFVNSSGTSQGYFGYGSSSNNVLYIVQQQSADIQFYNGSAVRGSISTGGTLTMGGDVVAYGSPSDKRLKENIKPIESALDKVSKLQGVTFDWKDKEKKYDQYGKPQKLQEWKNDIGFIAQDVQKIIPELVRENEDGMLSMRHQGIAPILLEAIKELKAEIEELKSNKCNCNK